MRRTLLALVASGVLAGGCDGRNTTAPSSEDVAGGPQFAAGGVVHRVSVGGSDFVGPGGDANFSLVAIEHADGTVTGQWSDQFGHGNGGLHIVIDCLEVDLVGDQAWVSGVAKGGVFDGTYWATRVRENPDQISFSVGPFAAPFNCHTRPNFPLFDKPNGQVKID